MSTKVIPYTDIGFQAPQTDSENSMTNTDDFLKLLMIELENQDPLQPMKNEDFIAQLAQMESLEELQELNKQMSVLVELQMSNSTESQEK